MAVIVYDTLKSHRFEPVVQAYTTRDTRLYALGLNIGADPTDADALRYVAHEPPVAVATMPMNLARLGPWMRDPAVGIDYRKMVVGEVSLRLHAILPPEGTVRGEHRILRVTDKGPGRGALVSVLRELRDEATGTLLAEFEQVSFCRADGGFATDGRHDPPEEAEPMPMPDRAPDLVVALPTLPQQALIYRLSGDMNPLHSDPEVARQAGFDRPILHGLATMGMAGHALDRASGNLGAAALRSIRGRLSGPVLPGQVLRLDAWRDAAGLRFRVANETGREVVSHGRVEFH
jgi:acyl dehydratase